MKWFEGAIPDAIQRAKAKNNIFIVYITGEDDLSKQMNDTWEDTQVTNLCEQEGCVAVKINANSDECRFFSQIYPVVVVPSTFFIGVNGTPLEVTGGYVECKDFVDKIKAVVLTHKSKLPAPQPAQTTSTASTPPVSEPVIAAASAASPAASEPTAASTSASVSSEGTKENEEPTEAKKAKIDLDVKVEKAKELLEKKREEKMKKEQEEAKRKEMERIKLGQEVQKLRQYQQDRELKETQHQIKKDREEDRKARERVKEQIARDRAERAARFNKEKAEREKAQEEAKRAKLMAQQQAAAEAEAKRSETARLQFRMPDGSSATQTFPSGETLQQAYNFASQQFGGSVTLSTTFPRRTFTDADMNNTFVDLQLAPSAVIMVVPGQRSVLQRGGGGGGGVTSSGIMGLIFAPFVFLMNLIRSLFSSFSPSSPPPGSSPQQQEQRTTATASGGDRRTGAYQRRSEGSGGISRTEGKVHRFRNNDDDDDETATWNGNSTQQM